MERESFVNPNRAQFTEHKQVGPLVLEAENLWEQTAALFKSTKAREQLLVKEFFPSGFINRYVIPAHDEQAVSQTLTQLSLRDDLSIGIRTAYSNPKPGVAPYLMQNTYQPSDKFLSSALENYQSWMQVEEKPEAIIIMENPKYLGDSEAADESFVLHAALIPSESRCILEGRLYTDQTRILEETNKNYRRELNFRGQIAYELTPKRVMPLALTWEKPFLMEASIESRFYLQNIGQYLISETNLSDMLARMISLNLVTSHETLQFQGRRSLGPDNQSYFDFFLGYGIRGAQEKEITERAVAEQNNKYPRSKLKDWQKPFYE